MKFLRDLWVMLTHNDNGIPSSTKFWQLVGYIVSSWVIVYLTLHDSMSAEYLLIYLGAATASRGFQNYLATKNQANQPSQDYPSWTGGRPLGGKKTED